MRLDKLAPALCAAFLLISVGGCSVADSATFHIFAPTEIRRGQIVDPDALKQLTIGTSSRADAVAVMGTPTAKATFDDNTWIYIGQITSTRIGQVPGVDMQKVVLLSFDQGGILRGIKQLDKGDSKAIAMTPGSTKSPGSEASFMQQLLGNVGKFTPAGIPGGLGSQTGPSAGGGFGANSGNSLH